MKLFYKNDKPWCDSCEQDVDDAVVIGTSYEASFICGDCAIEVISILQQAASAGQPSSAKP